MFEVLAIHSQQFLARCLEAASCFTPGLMLGLWIKTHYQDLLYGIGAYTHIKAVWF